MPNSSLTKILQNTPTCLLTNYVQCTEKFYLEFCILHHVYHNSFLASTLRVVL